MQNQIAPLQLFYSYADSDENLCEELEKHLSILQRQGIIAGWHRHKILPGEDRNQINDEQFSSAQIILLLISPDFLVEEHSHSEMEQALQRQRAGLSHVIPLLLRPVDWKPASFAHLQLLPRNGVPVTTWKNHDEAFADIAKDIRLAIERQPLSSGTSSGSQDQVPRFTRSRPPLIIRIAGIVSILVTIIIAVVLMFSYLSGKNAPNGPTPTPTSSLTVFVWWYQSSLPIYAPVGNCERHPSRSCSTIDSISPRKRTSALCQAQGELISVNANTSEWWTMIKGDNGQWGWISNVYLQGREKIDNIPDCK